MDNKKITITIPTFSLSAYSAGLLDSYTSVKQKFQNIFILFYETGADMSYRTKRSAFHSMKSVSNGFNNFNKRKAKKLLMLFIPLLVIVILVTAAVQAFRGSDQSGATVLSSNSDDTAEATYEINKNFDFPLIDTNEKKIGTFAYTIQNAELRNEIIVKGQRASSVPGRVFLIFNLQLKNTLKQGLEINSRDYVRLSVNGDKENLLAPEIHNDPVEVQAISTKFTRLGFAINDTDRDLVLIVGEIDGEKQEIPVKF